MNQSEFETKFCEYREFLRDEIYRFRDCVTVYRQLNERRKEEHKALYLAPVFFRVVESGLWTSIILWADKLFAEKGECGIFNFLNFIEQNRKWMSVLELKRRRDYPDNHWMIKERVPITFQSIETDRQKIISMPALKAFRVHRDKYQGHFDRAYSFEQERLTMEAPINWSDLEEAGQIMGQIMNDYSADFDGNTFLWSSLGIDDVNSLLNHAINGYVRPQE